MESGRRIHSSIISAALLHACRGLVVLLDMSSFSFCKSPDSFACLASPRLSNAIHAFHTTHAIPLFNPICPTSTTPHTRSRGLKHQRHDVSSVGPWQILLPPLSLRTNRTDGNIQMTGEDITAYQKQIKEARNEITRPFC